MSEQTPPRLAELLLRLVLAAEYRDFILGDLNEQYRQRLPAEGRRSASRWYWRQLRESVGPSARRRWDGVRARHAAPPGLDPRGRKGAGMFDKLNQDVRYALRTLSKNPGWTTSAVMTLALAIGATTAIFTVVNAVLLQPLPFEEPGELVAFTLWDEERQEGPEAVSFPAYDAWRTAQTVFRDFGGYALAANTIDIGEGAERLFGLRVSAGLFPTLGVDPFLGRAFEPAEDDVGSEPVVILSHGFWQRRFGADPGVLGTTISIDETPHVVIGVMPADFMFPWPDADYFVNLSRGPRTRSTWFLELVGRLDEGLTFDQARSRIESASVTVSGADERPDQVWQARITPLHRYLVGDVRPMLLVFMSAVATVLLIASINVANLMLGRGAGRRREHTVRAALGAGRMRLIQQVVTESTLLAFAGGALGLLLSVGLTRVLLNASPAPFPQAELIGIDVWVVLFTAAVAFGVGAAVGLIPAMRASRVDLNAGLRDGARGSEGRATHRLRDGLVVAQLALTLALLVGAALLLRSFAGLVTIERGYEVDVLAFATALPASRYPELADKHRFHQQQLEALRALPGVESAALAGQLPFGGFSTWDYLPEGGDEPGLAHVQFITPQYFATLRIPLLAGRDFDESDGTGGLEYIIVNEQLARAHWPDGDAVGRRMQLEGETMYQIIGVVEDTRFIRLEREPMPQVYFPYANGIWQFNVVSFLRSAFDPIALAGPARDAIAALDDTVPVSALGTLEARMWRSVSEPRFRTLLIGVFGASALLLALVGVYGVMAHNVAQRTHELGIRKALGADRGSIVQAVLGRGLALSALGVALGLWGAWAVGGALESYLFGVGRGDVLTFAGAIAVLLLAAGAATILPARRAAAVDPVVALRSE